MASGMIVLGAQVKRLNWGCISCVVEIDLLIRGSTSAWVTFTGIGKEVKKVSIRNWVIRKQISKPSQCFKRSQAFDAVNWIRREHICHVSLITTSHVLRIGADVGTWLVDCRHLRDPVTVTKAWECRKLVTLLRSLFSYFIYYRVGKQYLQTRFTGFTADGASIQSMPTYMKRQKDLRKHHEIEWFQVNASQ